VAVGAPARAISVTRRAAPGVRYRRTARAVWVYRLRHGRVVAVATASRSLARHPRALAAAMRRLASAGARQATPSFKPSAAQAQQQAAGTQPTGQPLAGTSDPNLNAALALLCHLQVSAPAGSPVAVAR
jgi:hypothetical protein